jgi:glycosyltransferase involved in cell wall biosynthesis
MRIGFFSWEYPPRLIGGLGTYADYITRYLVRMGADVVVFTVNTGTLRTSEVINGVEVHRPLNVDASGILRIIAGNELQSWGDQLKFFSSIFTNDVLCSAKFVNSLIRLQHAKFDMACVHDWLGGMAASIIKAETDLPVAFHVHSTEWGRSRGMGSKAVNDIEYHTSVIADRIVTVSYAMKEDLVNHGWPGEKIYVVWNGVDPDVYNPKNVALRLEFVSEHERIVHYAASDLCVFPSLYEPFGIVSLEAMALEKPIVVGAKGVSGLKEQVVSAGPGQTGIHVDGGSPADIARGVKKILASPEKARLWGRNARERVLNYFTSENAARQTLDVYEGMVQSAGRK